MKKVKISIVVIAILIIVSGNTLGFSIPIVEATSDDSNNVIPFEGELLPQLSPSNEKVIQPELTPSETIVQSDSLQNPSIQDSLKQQQQQQPLNLNSGKQQDNQSNTGSQGAQNNLSNIGDPFNLCNPYGGTCKTS